MCPPQERKSIQHHCHGGKVSCHGGSVSCRRGQGLFFLFIALRWMQNPIGGCCSRLKIPELARGIFSRLQRPWLVRDICIRRKGFFRFLSFPTDTGATRDDTAQGVFLGFCLFCWRRGRFFSPCDARISPAVQIFSCVGDRFVYKKSSLPKGRLRMGSTKLKSCVFGIALSRHALPLQRIGVLPAKPAPHSCALPCPIKTCFRIN